jgi:hypothetical protein
MNDFARLHSGDDVFKRIMIGTTIGGFIFAMYMIMY